MLIVFNKFYKYFKDKLLPSKYSYQSRNIADAPKDLMGRLVIITSQGYENSNLEEIINGSWNTEHIKKISYKSLDTDTPKSDAIKLNIDDVKIFNNTSLSIVVPKKIHFSLIIMTLLHFLQQGASLYL